MVVGVLQWQNQARLQIILAGLFILLHSIHRSFLHNKHLSSHGVLDGIHPVLYHLGYFSGLSFGQHEYKRPPAGGPSLNNPRDYSVDSISNPHASSKGSGMYLEFLLRRAHSRRRVERRYWSGVSLYSFTTCSNSVTVGTIGPMGSGFPQFGFPRRFAMNVCLGAWVLMSLDSGGHAKDSAPFALRTDKQRKAAGI